MAHGYTDKLCEQKGKKYGVFLVFLRVEIKQVHTKVAPRAEGTAGQ